MVRKLNLLPLLVGIFIAIISSGCGNRSSNITEGTEWRVTVYRAAPFNDAELGIGTDRTYNVADTAVVNENLKNVKPENLTLEWTLPDSEGLIWLVAYESVPVLDEKVTVTEVNAIPTSDHDFQVAFKFTDAKKWQTITRNNIGSRLALFVNGKLMNAPQVNSEITSGNCSVLISADMIHEFLPNLDLDKVH
ncbi:MAG: hypothetical protein K2O00_06825 [Muribaculaceae bacterium]|nr:hypothetical protein [Muribaculaceae bacterium]